MLENGADVHGTVQRQFWYLFTYDQLLKTGDPRMLVDKAGPATLYTTVTKITERSIDINAFRTGTNSVAMTISSIYHGPRWECVVKEREQILTKIPFVWSLEWCRALTFHLFGSNVALNDDVVMSALSMLEIEHVTEFQSHQE